MKTITAVVFAVSVGLGLSAVAVAEPFNSRGEDYIATVQSEADAVRSTATVTHSGFNDRGQDYIADTPSGGSTRESMISRRDTQVQGWNG